jgi:hypothetical protein
MSKFDPEKLSVEYREGVSRVQPIIPRRYTLTHSDVTAELFLTIGLSYAFDKISIMRDEVLGEWLMNGNNYVYHVYLFIDGDINEGMAQYRDAIFRQELPLALEAIRYGDQLLFKEYPELDRAPIVVYFNSTDPNYNKVEYWGTFADYIVDVDGVMDGENGNISTMDTYEEGLLKKSELLDRKYGDVNGDGITDQVMLFGTKGDSSEVYMEDIIIVIEDGDTKKTTTIVPEMNAGYQPTLFLGDFTGDGRYEIKVSIESGGSGGYGYHYIYSYENNNIYREIFNTDIYNMEHLYKVEYMDHYKVSVENEHFDKRFLIDISYKDRDYLSQLYQENGQLLKAVEGGVLALSLLTPIVPDERGNGYDLIAYQRIIGVTNSDTLGYVENMLSWDGDQFVPSRMLVSIPGSKLIDLYE